MLLKTTSALSALAVLGTLAHAANPPAPFIDFNRGPMRGFADHAQGTFVYGPAQEERLGTFVGLPIRFGGRADLFFGFAGSMIFRRQEPPEQPSYHRYRQGGAWTTLDELHLTFGFDEAGWISSLRLGWFLERANPDAAMLGEYLLRYRAYPIILDEKPAPWDTLGALQARVTGIRHAAVSPGGAFRSDAVLRMERSRLGDGRDFSAAYAAGFAPARGIDLGIGFNADRIVTAGGRLSLGREPFAKTDSGYVLADSTTVDTVFYRHSYSTHVFMARMAVEPLEWFGLAASGLAWRLFAEAAVMGWENRPIYYENRFDRIPVMAGMDVPTLGLLDRLCVQWERWPSPSWVVSGYSSYYNSPVWNQGGRVVRSDRREDHRVAVFASRRLASHLVLQAWYLDAPGLVPGCAGLGIRALRALPLASGRRLLFRAPAEFRAPRRTPLLGAAI